MPLVTVVGAIILPFFAVAASFAIQILGLFVDGRRNIEQARAQSRFLAALDGGRGRSISSRLFFSHLLDEWDRNLSELREGKITVLQEYWKVSAALYHHLARRMVECTSILPLEFWEPAAQSNAELLAYLDEQKTNLLAHGVRVRRTFILRAADIADDRAEQFFKIAYSQMRDGFEVFYVDLDGITDEHTKALLNVDFALIDDTILMIGRLSSTNRAVYYYDFYDLRAACATGIMKADLGVFTNGPTFAAGVEPPRLLLEDHRRAISAHPRLAEPGLTAYRDLFHKGAQ